jgi:hypothetical protein
MSTTPETQEWLKTYEIKLAAFFNELAEASYANRGVLIHDRNQPLEMAEIFVGAERLKPLAGALLRNMGAVRSMLDGSDSSSATIGR